MAKEEWKTKREENLMHEGWTYENILAQDLGRFYLHRFATVLHNLTLAQAATGFAIPANSKSRQRTVERDSLQLSGSFQAYLHL